MWTVKCSVDHGDDFDAWMYGFPIDDTVDADAQDGFKVALHMVAPDNVFPGGVNDVDDEKLRRLDTDAKDR